MIIRRNLCLLALLSFPAAAEDGVRLFLSKSFPGSAPAYAEVTLAQDGMVAYKEDPNDDRPAKFLLPAAETEELFALVRKLDDFRRPLESGLKVANTGIKTFRREAGEGKTEVKFNYSLDADARKLADWLDKVIETQQHLMRLERAVRFDRLGVYRVLLHLQMSMDRARLVAGDQFLPLLDRVAKGESFIHMARTRASHLAAAIRSGGEPQP